MSRFSQRHYIAIAATISHEMGVAWLRNGGHDCSPKWYKGRDESVALFASLIDNLERQFEADNPKFKWELFRTACYKDNQRPRWSHERDWVYEVSPGRYHTRVGNVRVKRGSKP